jgi:hypothetical protein
MDIERFYNRCTDYIAGQLYSGKLGAYILFGVRFDAYSRALAGIRYYRDKSGRLILESNMTIVPKKLFSLRFDSGQLTDITEVHALGDARLIENQVVICLNSKP